MTVKLQVEKSYISLTTDQEIFDEKEATAAVGQVKECQEHRERLILDLGKCKEVTLGALRALTRALSTVAQYETKVCIIANRESRKLIKEQGLERLFSMHASLDEIVSPNDPAGARQRALEFLNTTLEAVTYTLQVSTNTKATAGKTFLRGQAEVPGADIAATVGLISAPFTGALILAFPTATYLGIMSRLLGQEYKEMTPDIRDGAAELLNIILGQVKISLNEKGFAIKQAIPTVVLGEKLNVLPSSSRPSVIVPYTSDVGSFYIELTTNPNDNK
jgi:chemotaxis protein CheX